MSTNFGKFCYKLRVDNNELMQDMATKLGVTTAFLSNVENGKKKPPVEWKDKILKLYSISEAELEELERSFFEARYANAIDISNMDQYEKNILLSLARKFSSKDVIEDDCMEIVQFSNGITCGEMRVDKEWLSKQSEKEKFELYKLAQEDPNSKMQLLFIVDMGYGTQGFIKKEVTNKEAEE
ncbi:MAG: helix-turn-helix transcriptional regulator [Lachnospiraceae bacterium]|nr:helix-turn-helix transcriptional regulator [Lachnospiraceae bacterium]